MFLRKSLEIEPKNAKARQLLVQLKKKKRDQKALEKKLYTTLGGSKSTDSAETVVCLNSAAITTNNL
ncbi:hypothetical protein PF005_g23021 [Phytophthora fragariae]|uniref:Uncharacterized protein n=1 Tax=Phytophthora fragariae TaxID=53985 RepID=A0A6A3TV47_9STRA|nr:hypothetical protein PF009_g23779 [Phytophthora fragariae]KAE8973158.1 hypothetical protein PF011_g25366 [Phytophthora fragariae]KAE9105638.1 hypothetical protein PF010_g12939 [Phytophthora fragariae]KAE9117562.1 hypothetical protein PF007_g9235 [Phytophthora fragariae]KAE9142718.1 hypothetical protein PF006_g12188 [Phytophthora fragariae]